MKDDDSLNTTITIANEFHPDISTAHLDALSRKQHGCTGGTYSAIKSTVSKSNLRHAVSHSRVPDENIHEIPGRQRTSLAVVAKRVKQRVHTIGILNHGFHKLPDKAQMAVTHKYGKLLVIHHGLHHDGLGCYNAWSAI